MGESLDLLEQEYPLDLSIHKRCTRKEPQHDRSTKQSSSVFLKNTDVPENSGQAESSTISPDYFISDPSRKKKENNRLGGCMDYFLKTVRPERAFQPAYMDLKVPECFGYGLESSRERVTVNDSVATNLQVDHMAQSSTSMYTPDDSRVSCSYKKNLHRSGSVISITEDSKASTPENATFKCYECDMIFTGANNLARHFRAHHPLKQLFKCGNCNMLFTCYSVFSSHLKIHTGDVCEAAYTQLSDLKMHHRHHTGEKPFQCGDGEILFPSSSALSNHRKRSYTGEKSYKCISCYESFMFRSELTYHVVKTHSGEKPYKCNMCGKSFMYQSRLAYHVRTHTGDKPHKCTECEKSFSFRSQLSYHVTIHTGERPHKCTMCESSFMRPNELTRHMRTHTGEKPYTCIVCGNSYSQSYNLNYHQRRIHKVTNS